MHSSPALTPPPGNPRFPLLDSVRGLAAIAVVYAHAYDGLHRQATLNEHGYWDNLANAVGMAFQVFFAMSAFLLVRPYFAAWARGRPGPTPRAFWRRRILRVVPGYWVALTLTALLIPAAAPHVFSGDWWLFYGLFQVYSTEHIYDGLAVAWSLSVEASFYILVPALALLMRRAGAMPVIVAMLVLGVVVRVLNSVDLGGANGFVASIAYGLPGQASFFGVGLLLAWWSVHGAPAPLRVLIERPVLCWGLAAGVYLATSAVLSFANPVGGLDFRTRFIAFHLMTAVFVTFALLPAIWDERPSIVRSVLSVRALLYVGVVSFGLYLWHVPVEQVLLDEWLIELQAGWALAPRVALTFACVLALGMLAASASYRVVELPFLRRKERVAPRDESWFTSSDDALPADGTDPGARGGQPRPDPAGRA